VDLYLPSFLFSYYSYNLTLNNFWNDCSSQCC